MATLGLLAALASPACSTRIESDVLQVVSSTDVDTRDLSGTFAIYGEHGSSTVSAQASFSHARRVAAVQLVGGDEVYCEGVRLGSSGTSNAVDLPRKRANEPYRFELRRAGGVLVTVDVAAIDPVEVLAPVASTELRRTAPLTVRWTPASGTAVDAQLLSSCAMTHAAEQTESGELTVPAFEPQGVVGGPQNAGSPPCDGTLSLVRSRKDTSTTALGETHSVAEEADRVRVRVVE